MPSRFSGPPFTPRANLPPSDRPRRCKFIHVVIERDRSNSSRASLSEREDSSLSSVAGLAWNSGECLFSPSMS
jgi:hypothetical protein